MFLQRLPYSRISNAPTNHITCKGSIYFKTSAKVAPYYAKVSLQTLCCNITQFKTRFLFLNSSKFLLQGLFKIIKGKIEQSFPRGRAFFTSVTAADLDISLMSLSAIIFNNLLTVVD